MRISVRFAVGLMALLAFAAPAIANDCDDAVEAYNSATSEIDYRLRRYVRCIESSQGDDDCSVEFRRLKSAHEDFESAVSDYRSDCQ